MDIQDDRFTVFLRDPVDHTSAGEGREHPIASVASYGEARRVSQTYQRAGHQVVIRFDGPSGGGD
jgi:hypothetical protein